MSKSNTNQSSKKKRKLIITAAIVIALFLLVLFSTLAYLTSTTNTLDNVMTSGKITATLDEAKTDADGYGVKLKDGEGNDIRIPENPTPKSDPAGNNYTLIPGHEYAKDPVLRVGANSENCFIYLIVDDKMNGALGESVSTYDGPSPEQQMVGEGPNQWTLLENVSLPTGKTGKVYCYNSEVTKSDQVQPFASFTKFKLNPNLTNAQIATLGTAGHNQIIVNGVAIQSDGFSGSTVKEKAKAAWDAVYGETPKKDYTLTLNDDTGCVSDYKINGQPVTSGTTKVKDGDTLTCTKSYDYWDKHISLSANDADLSGKFEPNDSTNAFDYSGTLNSIKNDVTIDVYASNMMQSSVTAFKGKTKITYSVYFLEGYTWQDSIDDKQTFTYEKFSLKDNKIYSYFIAEEQEQEYKGYVCTKEGDMSTAVSPNDYLSSTTMYYIVSS